LAKIVESLLLPLHTKYVKKYTNITMKGPFKTMGEEK